MESKRVQRFKLTIRSASFHLFLVALFLISIFLSIAQAAPGDLDPTFGAGGIVTTTIGPYDNRVRGLVIQPDGKMVAAGTSSNGPSNTDIALVRYNPDGSLDSSFGIGGKVTTSIGTQAGANAIIIQPDGKIVVAGISVDGSFFRNALVRYNTDGSLDSSFGSGGIVISPFLVNGANALIIQEDGKLVAAARSGSDTRFGLARYNTDGSLDTTFGSGGIVSTVIPTRVSAGANALIVQEDGKLVAAGHAYNSSNREDFALARYNPDGTLDTTFGTGGIVTTAIGSFDERASALILQGDGKLVAAGVSSNSPNGSNENFALVRYSANGSLDSTFGTGGIVTTAIGNDAFASSLTIQGDGKLVAAGGSSNDLSEDFVLVRYNTDASLDSTFGVGGIVTTTIGVQANANALTIQGDGKLVAAGQASPNGDLINFAITRYLVDTTIRENCNDKNKGQGKDKGKGHDKGRCKGHDKDK